MRIVDVIRSILRLPVDGERERKGREIDALQVRSDATLRRADRLVPELDGAIASFRRRR